MLEMSMLENQDLDKDLEKVVAIESYAPEEIFAVQKPQQQQQQRGFEPPLQSLDKMFRMFYETKPYENHKAELEIRFGTKGIRPLTKNDYDNVIKKLKSSGFICDNPNGENSLRIQSMFLDKGGIFRESDIRTEIYGLEQIEKYCKTDNILEITRYFKSSVKFVKKSGIYNDDKRVYPVNFDDFNYRASLQNEDNISQGLQVYITNTFKESKKTFRYMNRVTFTNPDYPVKVDISIVKYGDRDAQDNRKPKWCWSVNESNVFQNPETYEIEIEVNNDAIGPDTKFNSAESLIKFDTIRKVIKLVVCGLQSTNYPCSYPEQKSVLESYMRLLGNEYNPGRRIENKYFIGPNSVTLQIENVASADPDSLVTNIRKDYTVTEKADGDRHLMFINKDGKIYLINTNMKVIFTGAVTENKECFNTLIDGELILYDKLKNFINLYAAFDIYYFKQQDLRTYPFMAQKDPNKSRLQILKTVMLTLNALEVSSGQKSAMRLMSPMRFTSKEFYKGDTIFTACNDILSKENDNLFEYNTDGLIFTPAYYGVGSNKEGMCGPKTKMTWEQSFKWKPPEYNTIDFLVTTVKKDGEDVVKPVFEDGTNVDITTQLTEFKTIQLRCSYNQRTHGYVNPCQNLIDGEFPENKSKSEDDYNNETKPVIFYPTEPYDPDAGTCRIMLRKDDNGNNQMFTEENDVFTDNTIVEFSYDTTREKGLNWVPLRVRYDKTTELLQGKKNFGNAYHVANNNWKSIHNPITQDMLRTGLNIPDILVNEDVYYNNSAKQFKTKSMKDFHNLYVKKQLIKSVCKRGDTLIDFACGKGGDLSKWVGAQLSFVYGIDIHKDNLENNKDGACARYLDMRKKETRMPAALFVNGNSSFNIKSGEAMLNDKAKQITKAVFGQGSRDDKTLGKGVSKQFAKGENGFNVSSCQFAIHYFFENPVTLKGFMKNVAECTQELGYFIGTAYDGRMVFDLLSNKQTDESIQIVENGQKVWAITKGYSHDTFEPNSSSIGYKIDVYQDSINKTFTEYLINFEYLDRIMGLYGFKLVDREEALSLGLPEGSGLFQELFDKMMLEIQQNKYSGRNFGSAANMKEYEKKISFLNRYFVYKKVLNVNADKVEIELKEYAEKNTPTSVVEEPPIPDIEEAVVEVAEPVVVKEQTKQKIRKLTKKLVLVPATEVIEEQANAPVVKPKKKLTIVK
jgi:hypothetical protein